MAHYFLGVDVGSSKTEALIADEIGRAVGYGRAGPGNHEVVGYEGLRAALGSAVAAALRSAGISKAQVAGAGFGVSGYDWPGEREPTLAAIASLGLAAHVEAVNDTILGLLAGAAEGWGVALVSGTGCNCRGLDRSHQREGKVTGHGLWMGEGAGASELIARALQAVARAWTLRGPATQLTQVFIEYGRCSSIDELLEKVTNEGLEIGAAAAPLVFRAAHAGDRVAADLIRWAGAELGELACAVIRQLQFEKLAFDVVLIGSMFEGGPMLMEPMRETIHALAPAARPVRLAAPPVVGAVILGMEQAGEAVGERREVMIRSARGLRVENAGRR